jgi:NAD dependent epimerase/dehydratase
MHLQDDKGGPMKIFLTGSEGFIGSHLLEALLAAGHEVTALAAYNSFDSYGWIDSTNAKDSSALRLVLGDIRDSEQMRQLVKGHECILHLAALIAIPYSYQAPESYVQTNVIGTLNLLNAAKEVGVERFIHTSTSEVYGTAEFVPITERHPLKGQSPYSASKIAADQMVYAYNASFKLPTITIRPFNTFGPRQSTRAVIPTVITQIANGKKRISLGSTSPTRDFTYVSDTVNGFIKALSAPNLFGSTINLGTGYEISISDLVTTISREMNQEIIIETSDERLRPKDSEVERLLADNSLALTSLNWRPEIDGKRGLEMGLKKTIAWFTDPANLALYRNGQFVV